MNDLISRQAAIDSVNELRKSPWYNTVPNIIRNEAVDIVEKFCIKDLPSAQPELIEKTAYIRGFEQGRTQGMIDTKAEEVAQSTADVVEVVRCKDCRFYTFKPQQTSRTTSVRRCNRSPIICTKQDDYCSFGERADV